jgi:gluconate kinase
LHIHENVNDSDEMSWLDNAVESISNIAKAHGKMVACLNLSMSIYSQESNSILIFLGIYHRAFLERLGGAC